MSSIGANKAFSQDAEKILKLQEKLSSIQNQIHFWSAKSKVFEQKENSNNFDGFVKAQISPTKSRQSLMAARQDWATLSHTQQYEILHNVARDYSRITLNFESLAMAIKASQASVAMKRVFESENDGNVDPEERKYLLELLDDEAELSDTVLQLEDDQLAKKLELIKVKCELAENFSNLRETYSGLLKNVPEEEISHAVPRKRQNSGEKMSRIEQKSEELKAEEDRLNQMRFLIQKLMMATPSCLNYDEETNKKHKSMLAKCGEDLSTLRGD